MSEGNDSTAAQVPGIEVRQSRVHGRGVFALKVLERGEVIGVYAGRRYGADELEGGWDSRLTYLFGLSDGSLIDGAQGGNATRHINHACAPNAEAFERWNEDDELEVVIRALRRIDIDEELFLDYSLTIDGDDPSEYSCACGTDTCRGTMAARVD